MNKFFLLLASILFFSGTFNDALAQKIKTDTLKVAGNCGMCQERIEQAAFVKGVKDAHWDKKTKELVVVYNTEKTSLPKIQGNIAKSGHDVAAMLAVQAAYDALPGCCRYRTASCED